MFFSSLPKHIIAVLNKHSLLLLAVLLLFIAKCKNVDSGIH